MTDENSSRRWPLSSLLALLAFVFIPATITVAGISAGDQVGTEIESSPDGLAYLEGDERSLSRIDRWVESRVPGRELAFEFDRTTTRILDDNYADTIATSDRVQLGRDGWLFLSDSTQQPCVTDIEEKEWAGEIDRVVTLLEAAGKQPVIAIAPDRAIVVPELIGDIQNTCQVQNRAVVERLAESAAVLDLSDVVRGESHALQIDTHWSPAGAMAGIRPMVETIRPGTWEDRPLTSEVVERRGDLDGLLGYENTETVNVMTIEQPTPTSLEAFPTSLEGRPLVQARTPGAAERHVLLLHDSYGGYSSAEEPDRYLTGLGISYLRPWFERVDNVRFGGTSADSIADAAVIQSLEDADTVAMLAVQRTLPVRLRTGGLSTPLASALADRLGTEVDPSTPFEEDGFVILAGFSGSTEDFQISPVRGSIRDRVNFNGRVALLVDGGTQLQFGRSPVSAIFVPLSQR